MSANDNFLYKKSNKKITAAYAITCTFLIALAAVIFISSISSAEDENYINILSSDYLADTDTGTENDQARWELEFSIGNVIATLHIFPLEGDNEAALPDRTTSVRPEWENSSLWGDILTNNKQLMVYLSGITHIGSYDFYGFPNDIGIIYNDNNEEQTGNLSSIGTAAMQGLELQFFVPSGTTFYDGDIYLDDNISSIGQNAFSAVNYASNLSILAATASLGNRCFWGSSIEMQIIMSDELGAFAFLQCTNLHTIYMNSPTIPASCFMGCSSLTTILPIEDYLFITSIGDSAFSGCTSLEGIDLFHVTSIGDSAFSGCTSLIYVRLGSEVTYIGNNAFYLDGGRSFINLNGQTVVPTVENLSGKTWIGSTPAELREAVPVPEPTETIYNGTPQKPTDTPYYSVSGSQTDAGTYEVTYTLNEGYFWADNSTSPKSVAFTILPVTLMITWGTDLLIYNGNPQLPTYVLNGVIGSDIVTVTATEGLPSVIGTYTRTVVSENPNYVIDPTTATIDYRITLLWSDAQFLYSATTPTEQTIIEYTGPDNPPKIIIPETVEYEGFTFTITEYLGKKFTFYDRDNVVTPSGGQTFVRWDGYYYLDGWHKNPNYIPVAGPLLAALPLIILFAVIVSVPLFKRDY